MYEHPRYFYLGAPNVPPGPTSIALLGRVFETISL